MFDFFVIALKLHSVRRDSSADTWIVVVDIVVNIDFFRVLIEML